MKREWNETEKWKEKKENISTIFTTTNNQLTICCSWYNVSYIQIIYKTYFVSFVPTKFVNNNSIFAFQVAPGTIWDWIQF